MGESRTVKLISMDENSFEVSADILEISELMKTLIVEQDDDEIQEIPLPSTKGEVVAKVIEYCQHYKEDPMKTIERPMKTNNVKDAVSEWYGNYVDMEDTELLFGIIIAANYLDIKPLLDLCCAKAATIIKNKTPEEIRQTLGITQEFSPAEEEMIRDENKWDEDL